MSMNRFCFFMLIALTFSNAIRGQENASISLLIKDSIKTIKYLENEEISMNKLLKRVNKRISFKLLFKNNNSQDIMFCFLNRDIREAIPLSMVKDTTVIIKDTTFFRNYDGCNPNSLFPINSVPAFLYADTTSTLNDTLRAFYKNKQLLFKLNLCVLNNIGITYMIVDENDSVLLRDVKVSHVYYSSKGFKRLVKTTSRSEKETLKKHARDIKKCSAPIKIRKKLLSKVKLYYFNNMRKYNSCDFYVFKPNSVYYITVYYTFYYNSIYADPHYATCELFDAIKKNIVNNRINEEKIFQGQIKSNRIKLIVK